MQLPDWVDQPVPEYPLKPIHDAIGKFVGACKGLELWIDLLYGQFVPGMFYAKAVKVDIGQQIDELADLAHLVPDVHQEEYLEHLAVAKEIVELRNGVIHGVGMPNVDETVWQSQRPDRRGKVVDPENHPWLYVDYSRELLIGAGIRAMGIGGFIQSNCSRWPHFNRDENPG